MISLYILFNSFSFQVYRLILHPLAGKVILSFLQALLLDLYVALGTVPSYSLCVLICHTLNSPQYSVSPTLCFYHTQFSRVLIWLESWYGINILFLISTLCASSVYSFTASNPNTCMSQSLDCSDRDEWIVLLKQVPRWSVLKKRLGLCHKRDAESECKVCRVARREDLCVVCAGQRKSLKNSV